ncbi:MAG: hypothetical protein GY754_23715 [bacterium]|nr:hypothetical protein [bacterium]
MNKQNDPHGKVDRRIEKKTDWAKKASQMILQEDRAFFRKAMRDVKKLFALKRKK